MAKKGKKERTSAPAKQKKVIKKKGKAGKKVAQKKSGAKSSEKTSEQIQSSDAIDIVYLGNPIMDITVDDSKYKLLEKYKMTE